MKVIAIETLIMSGVIVKPGEIVDLDESVLANLEGLVEPVGMREALALQGEQPLDPQTPATEPVVVEESPVAESVVVEESPVAEPVVVEEPQVPTETGSSTKTKKEGK